MTRSDGAGVGGVDVVGCRRGYRAVRVTAETQGGYQRQKQFDLAVSRGAVLRRLNSGCPFPLSTPPPCPPPRSAFLIATRDGAVAP
jgi:hypothetical protein